MNLLHAIRTLENNCLKYDFIRLFFSITRTLYFAASLEEESDEGYPGVIPVGRGLSTMTRPTT